MYSANFVVCQYVLFIHYFAYATHLSLSLSLGLAAVVAKIPEIDQFRWPGYFTIVYALLLGIVTMVGLRERRGDVQKKGGPLLPRRLPIPLYVSTHLFSSKIIAVSNTCILEECMEEHRSWSH